MANFVIQTRQKADVLFPVAPTPASVAPSVGLPIVPPDPSAVPPGVSPLKGNASTGFGPVEIDGYAEIGVFVVSDQPFTLTFSEGILPSGPFPLTQTFIATASGGQFIVAQRFFPTGSFMKMTILNNAAAPEIVLSLLVQGIPI